MTAFHFHGFVWELMGGIAELAGGVTLYLCSERAEYLNGRYFDSNWDIDEAEARREEIVARDLLKLTLRGEFGDKVVA